MTVSSSRWQWARYMTMNVATRSSGTPPLIPPGGRQRSRRFGNSGKRVASAAAAAVAAAAVADVDDDDDAIPGTTPERELATPGPPHDAGICDGDTIFETLSLNRFKAKICQFLPVANDPCAYLPSWR